MDIANKLPPQNLEAEVSVLGSILLENESFAKSLEIISETDFYRAVHRKIFSAMQELFEKNEPVDLLTLSDTLRKRNELEEVGGVDYLASLEEVVPTSANIQFHSKIVKEKAILRRLISTSTEIISKGFESDSDVEMLLDYAEKIIFEISENKIRSGFSPLNEIITNNFEAIEKLFDKKQLITGVATGFKDFDNKTSGMQPSDLIIIAGRPSMGKTTFALNIARNAGIDAKIPVAIFSLEMSKEQLGLRMLCSEARINSNKLRTGYLAHSDWPDLTNAADKLTKAPIFIDDTPALTALDVRTRARRLKSEHNIGLIIIDYLQLMRGRHNVENRQQEVSEISRSLKALAKELKVPVIALSQLSRAVETRTEKRPQLSDLRESGAIEQDADLVAFLYREEVYNKDTENKGIAEILIEKHRNGPTGVVTLIFLSEFTRFENHAKNENEALYAEY